MTTPVTVDREVEKRLARMILDVFIRLGMILLLVLLCYRVFSPFLSLMLWALILAVTIYPLHQGLAVRIGNRQKLASVLLILFSLVLIVMPTTVLVSSLGDSVYSLVHGVKNNTLQVPLPDPRVEAWPIVGEELYGFWSQAHTNLPGLVESMQPKIGEVSKKMLGLVAGLGGKMVLFFLSFVVAGIIMAFGVSGAGAMRKIFRRIIGAERGDGFAQLATLTIRSVAAGVIGIACIQALLIGLVLLLAGIPLAGLLAMLVLVLGVAQLPALLVTLPAIGYLWYGGDYTTGGAIGYSVLLVVAGSVDNVLKPMFLGRGVDAPMPVVLLGALGGMATGGILGMFIGATLLAVGYQLFMRWVEEDPEQSPAP